MRPWLPGRGSDRAPRVEALEADQGAQALPEATATLPLALADTPPPRCWPGFRREPMAGDTAGSQSARQVTEVT